MGRVPGNDQTTIWQILATVGPKGETALMPHKTHHGADGTTATPRPAYCRIAVDAEKNMKNKHWAFFAGVRKYMHFSYTSPSAVSRWLLTATVRRHSHIVQSEPLPPPCGFPAVAQFHTGVLPTWLIDAFRIHDHANDFPNICFFLNGSSLTWHGGGCICDRSTRHKTVNLNK